MDSGHEDWELWARAVIDGYTLMVVPEPLYWYRVGDARGMLTSSVGRAATARKQRATNHARSLRPYIKQLARQVELQDVVELAQQLYLASTG